jgi:hypothetical protein
MTMWVLSCQWYTMKDVYIVKLKAGNNKQLLIFFFLIYFINKNQYINDTHSKLVSSTSLPPLDVSTVVC